MQSKFKPEPFEPKYPALILRDERLRQVIDIFTANDILVSGNVSEFTPHDLKETDLGKYGDIVLETLNVISIPLTFKGEPIILLYTSVNAPPIALPSGDPEELIKPGINSYHYITIGGQIEKMAIENVPPGVPVYCIADISGLKIVLQTPLNVKTHVLPFFSHPQLKFQVVVSEYSLLEVFINIFRGTLLGADLRQRLRAAVDKEKTDIETGRHYPDGVSNAAWQIVDAISEAAKSKKLSESQPTQNIANAA